MDINITGQVASTLADNLKQNPYITVGTSALGGAVTGIITLMAVKITNNNAEKREKQRIEHINQLEKQKIKTANCQRMQQAYSELMGRKHRMMMTYAAYYNAFMARHYKNSQSKVDAIASVDYDLFSKIPDDVAVQELNKIYRANFEASDNFRKAEREREKAISLMLPIGENQERLQVTLALIRVLFPRTPKIEDLFNQIQKSLNRIGNFEEVVENSEDALGEKMLAEAHRLKSNHAREIFSQQWTSETASLYASNCSHLKRISSDLNTRIDDLLHYLDNEMKDR